MDPVNLTTIVCPGCGAELEPTAETCRKCGGTTVKPGTNESKVQLQQLLDRPWVIVVLMLHVGLLGIPVYWKTKYSLGARVFLVVTSIVYTVGVVVIIVVMLQWLVHLATGG